MIPRLIHHVWVGPRPFPHEARARVAEWQRLNPDFRIKCWDESSLAVWPRFLQEAYAAGAWNRVANYMRLHALHSEGGVYLDHDVTLIKPLAPLLDDAAFAGLQTLDPWAPDLVNNAVLGAVAGHPMLRAIMVELEFRNGLDEVGSATGPGLLSSVLRSRGLQQPMDEPVLLHDLKLYPPRWFYPYLWHEDECTDLHPDTVAVHSWDATWKGRDFKLQDRLRRVGIRIYPRLFAERAKSRNVSRRGLAMI